MTWPAGPVTVRAPATSANLGPGFDSFGLALGLHDVVTARVTPGGVAIEVTGMGTATAGAGEQHLVIRAMRTAFAAIGGQPPGIALSCVNAIPQGYGLGSSAAGIVAGILAARALAGEAGMTALPDDAVLRMATRLEGHPDNVAACLAGGLTIAWEPGTGARTARLAPLPRISAVLCVPAQPLATVTARQVLPPEVPHAAAAANSARAALLVAALTSRPDLLMDGTEDYLHQRYRATAMPATASLIARLRDAGIPAVVSGAGPSVLAFTLDGAGPAAGDVAAVAEADGVAWQVLPLRVDTCGATIQAG
ncbi:MAG TPA: homoserine kinase [Streptosporangiaceae bacterium]|nr:homoserine kinase [Streptosporangiaceae bacterium]